MKIIFIRHGEPNYEIDSLTEKGWREAELLSKRTAKWNVTDFYCSPLGRAKDTASFTLKNAGREAEILPWLREFDAPVIDPETGKRRIPWDFLPDVLDANRDLYDQDFWTKNPIMQTGNMDENYHFVTDGLDALLARYGYDVPANSTPAQQKRIIMVFQMHFRPDLWNGVADVETMAIAEALLEKYGQG